jgi:hypothetical protein
MDSFNGEMESCLPALSSIIFARYIYRHFVAYLWQNFVEKGGNPSKLTAIRLATNRRR